MRDLAKPHCFSTVILLLTVLSFFSIAKSKDTLSATESLGPNQTLVSAGEVFELGFFELGTDVSRWYLGIWYKKIEQRTVVWVANRDNPLPNNSSSLKIGYDEKLSLVDESGNVSWSSNQSQSVGVSKNPILQLLDSGNLVLKEANEINPNKFLWQSFDYPTNTLLPDMKLGWNLNTGLDRYISSWKSLEDPSTGDYSFKLDYHGFPEVFLRQKESIIYRSGPWNGLRFSGVPEMNAANGIGFNFVVSDEEVYYSFSEQGNKANPALNSRLIVAPSGNIQRLTWIESSKIWNQYWFAPKDQCDNYSECGPYGVCDANASPVCKCMKGFRPKNPSAWSLRDGSDGCERETELECGNKDKFMKVENVKLPESGGAVVDMEMSFEECKVKCLGNCSCSGYSSARIQNGGSGCVMWFGNLMDMRSYADGGQEFHLRLAASELDGDGKTKRIIMIVGIVVGFAVLLSAGLIICFVRRRRNSGRTLNRRESKGPLERSQDFLLNSVVVSSKKDHYSGDRSNDDLELPLFDFSSVAAATENFSDENKLGQGGFGCVYKGLVEGQEIAVKRLSKNSGQGTEEFKNEVKLIARLQHRNLVRLLGCCVDVDEKVLIYEYMENKSLDSFLFDKTKRYLLDWQKRFNIICGIARGLLYLHQDSRFRIIHRDLKASNILLDGELDPKISDFGMARIFGQDQTEANTKKVVGTYGYMSPEYAMDGLFSIKSDVFSFGVLVLEIVSGQKNRGFYYSNNELNLLGHAWELWNEGRALDIIDSSVGASFSESEVLRCMQVGLLCVQERAEDRPTMSSVVLMLSSENAPLPQPKNPGFCLGRKPETESSSSKQDESFSVNQVTITILDPR
ncbi:receptor-like serine/threonine-protein kinase SD1-8 [Rosa sericea]